MFMLHYLVIEIPKAKLSPEILDNIIEEYILREGTDYGSSEFSLEHKKNHIYKQLDSNKILITYDEETDSINLTINN